MLQHVCVGVHAHAVADMEIKGQLVGIGCLPVLCGLCVGIQSGCQLWQQAPYPLHFFPALAYVPCQEWNSALNTLHMLPNSQANPPALQTLSLSHYFSSDFLIAVGASKYV